MKFLSPFLRLLCVTGSVFKRGSFYHFPIFLSASLHNSSLAILCACMLVQPKGARYVGGQQKNGNSERGSLLDRHPGQCLLPLSSFSFSPQASPLKGLPPFSLEAFFIFVISVGAGLKVLFQ